MLKEAKISTIEWQDGSFSIKIDFPVIETSNGASCDGGLLYLNGDKQKIQEKLKRIGEGTAKIYKILMENDVPILCTSNPRIEIGCEKPAVLKIDIGFLNKDE